MKKFIRITVEESIYKRLVEIQKETGLSMNKIMGKLIKDVKITVTMDKQG